MFSRNSRRIAAAALLRLGGWLGNYPWAIFHAQLTRGDKSRSSVVQPPTRAQNINVLIWLADEYATGDTVFGVDQLA